MKRKILYLDLLILCAILSQSIIGTFADEDIRESSNFLVRQKRVISQIAEEDNLSHIQDYPYVVQIKRLNRIFCVGAILSQRVVITAAECAQHPAAVYKVASNAARTTRGTIRNVTEIKLHHGNHPGRPLDGIALLTVIPDFQYSEYCKKINLHVGLLLPGIIGTISGWGFNFRNGDARGTKHPSKLRSIQVPIIAHQECLTRYRRFYEISDMDICTFHANRNCGHNDAGAPLVIDNSLVGIFIGNGALSYNGPKYPDVFALLQHVDYRTWIRDNI